MIAVAVPVAVLALAAQPVPSVLERIAVCETGNNPAHSTRDFISRFGIRRVVWNEYKDASVRPVPARKREGERLPSRVEQDAVALAIARKAGLTAWECYRANRWVRNGWRVYRP